MPVELIAMLERLLQGLEAERGQIDRQIGAIRMVLDGARPSPGRKRARTSPRSRRRRRRMSAAARKAVGERMTAYWAKRRAAEAKSKRRSKKAA
jgi:hypothetical protein